MNNFAPTQQQRLSISAEPGSLLLKKKNPFRD
jgi:hypothetical protein